MTHQTSHRGWIPLKWFRTAIRLALISTLATVLGITHFAHAQAAPGWTYHLLYQFKPGLTGAYPYATPVMDEKGNLYGTTCNDGAFSSGVVWKLSPSGTETVLYAFKQTGGGGSFPYSSLVMDAAGNLYGTTQYGGVYGGPCGVLGCGVVFKVDPSGKETVLHRFTGAGGDGYISEQGMVMDPHGNLFGTAVLGGAKGYGVVFKINPSGDYSIFHSYSYGKDGYYTYGGALVQDSAGNLYGANGYGGASGSGTVFKLSPTGKLTVLHGFGAAGDGVQPTGTVVLDSAGNLYGVTSSGGAFNFGTIFKVDATGTETILHSFTGVGGDGALPIGGLARDSAGNLYGTTESGGAHYLGTVFKLDSANKETILLDFNASNGRNPEFTLSLDSKGNLYGTTYEGGIDGAGVIYELTHN